MKNSGLAFPTLTGLPTRQSNFRKPWHRALTALEWTDDHPLSGLVFHELRHTAAALAIAQGAHPLVIKERLGHSSITVTLDRYGGLFPSLDGTYATPYRENLVTVKESTGLEGVAELLTRQRIRRLPVVDANGKLLGVVSRRDVLRWAASRVPEASRRS